MIMRHIGYLTIICTILIISAGCTAPPSGISNSQNTSAEPIPTATVVPAATPAAFIDPDHVTPVTPYPTPASGDGIFEPNHSIIRSSGNNNLTVIYSEKIDFRFNEISMVVDLPHSPLIIDLNITPEQGTRIKEGTSVYGEKKDYRYLIDHIGNNVWFECTVQDADTGTIVARDGFGRTFSHDCRREIVIRRPGTYTITFNGNYVIADIVMTSPR